MSAEPLTEQDLAAIEFRSGTDSDHKRLLAEVRRLSALDRHTEDGVAFMEAELRDLRTWKEGATNLLKERAQQAEELLQNRDALLEKVSSLQADLATMIDLDRQLREHARIIRDHLEKRIATMEAKAREQKP